MLYNMVDFQRTRRIQDGTFTLVAFETSVHRELKLVEGGMHIGRKGHLFTYKHDPYILSEESLWN